MEHSLEVLKKMNGAIVSCSFFLKIRFVNNFTYYIFITFLNFAYV